VVIMSLVDKLDGVHRGDLLRLFNKEGVSVVGYVLQHSDQKVRLSHEDPSWTKHNTVPNYGRGIRMDSRYRNYKLKHFDNYEILKPQQKA